MKLFSRRDSAKPKKREVMLRNQSLGQGRNLSQKLKLKQNQKHNLDISRADLSRKSNFLKRREKSVNTANVGSNIQSIASHIKSNSSSSNPDPVKDFLSRPRYISSLRDNDSNLSNKKGQGQANIINSGFDPAPKNSLPIFKKKNNKSKRAQLGSDLAKMRKRKMLASNLSAIDIKIPFKIIGLFILIISSIAVFFILNNSAFKIRQVDIIAPKEVLGDIESFADTYINQNIHTIREDSVSYEVKKIAPEIDKVYLYKKFPDTIMIEAVQGNPILILANLEEVTLLDLEGKNIGNFSIQEKIELGENERLILDGERNIESEFIQARYLEGKSDEEKLLFNWAEVPAEEKNKVYDTLKSEVEQKIQSYYTRISEVYSKSIYNTLPLIQSYFIKEMDPEDINISAGLIDLIVARGVKVSKIVLSTKFTLELFTEEGKIIKLSLRRPVDQQIKELDTFIYAGSFAQAKIIDLRSDTYSITR